MYNPILCAGVTGWAAAQLIKFLLHFFQSGNFNPERLYGSGGMPSSHSAMVCAAMFSAGKLEGFGSPIFAAFFIFGMIVMYDAANVRYAAGQHAKELNMIRRLLFEQEHKDSETKQKELKEFLGHTPFQVVCGAILGILLGVCIPW